MYSLTYRITTQAPIVITAQSGDMNMVNTEKFLPGTTILGIVAKRFIQQSSITGPVYEDPDFYQGILSGQLTYCPAFPVFEGEGEVQYMFLPTPFSIHQEKHGDEIFDLIHAEETPDEPTTAMEKFCALDRNTISVKDVDTSLNFHHARDRQTGTAKPGFLFTYESLDSAQIFEGSIFGDDSDLRTLLKTCGTSWTAHVGRSKNAQYGAVEFTFINTVPEPYNVISPGGNEVVLTLLSDTVLFNPDGFPTADQTPLQRYLDEQVGQPVTIISAFLKPGVVENFVSVYRLKRPSESCLKSGSSVLISLKAVDAATRQNLAELQVSGLGERTHEGFGRCRFGWQQEESLKEMDIGTPSLEELEEKPPKITLEILKTVIISELEKKVELLALQEQKTFRQLPSNSLIGRLENAARNPQKPLTAFVKELRKTAKDQLEGSYSPDFQKTLYQFLCDHQVFSVDLLKKSSSSKRLNDDYSLLKEQDHSALTSVLYKKYFATFFAMMRKRNNKKEDV